MKKKLIIWLMLTISPNILANEIKLCGVEWPPFTFVEDKKFVNGISVDVHKEAFKRLGISYKSSVLPWPRCLAQVEKGIYDAVIDNAPLAPYIFGKVPTGVYPLGVYVREGSTDSKFSWKFMEGKKVGMVRGYDYTEKITRFKGWKAKFAKSDKQLLLKLKAKRTDYVILDIFSADILMEQAGVKIKMLTPLIDSTDLYLVFNKDKTELSKKYDAVIQSMVSDGTMNNIYKKYLPFDYSQILKMQGG